jgi:glutaredoxin-like YruB-family protein
MADSNSAKVIIYSTPWCAFCKTEKQYLEHLGVSFVSKDIEEDATAFEELATKTGGQTTGVPVTDIDGDLVYGFDRRKIDELLRQKQLVAA